MLLSIGRLCVLFGPGLFLQQQDVGDSMWHTHCLQLSIQKILSGVYTPHPLLSQSLITWLVHYATKTVCQCIVARFCKPGGLMSSEVNITYMCMCMALMVLCVLLLMIVLSEIHFQFWRFVWEQQGVVSIIQTAWSWKWSRRTRAGSTSGIT